MFIQTLIFIFIIPSYNNILERESILSEKNLDRWQICITLEHQQFENIQLWYVKYLSIVTNHLAFISTFQAQDGCVQSQICLDISLDVERRKCYKWNSHPLFENPNMKVTTSIAKFYSCKKFIALSYKGYVIVLNFFGMFLHHNLEELLMVVHSN
jgi:hypothetical protein